MPNLFDQNSTDMAAQAPLAERMRPRDFNEFLGQSDIIALGKPLREAIEKDTLQSVILWGPPGSGKTTLARIVALKTKSQFEPFSAVTSGVADLRKLVSAAKQRHLLYKQKTILFVDEIHRFNKAQQDAFLPFVEDGTIILIGATTENPSFDIISPLLSRSLVIVLKSLNDLEMAEILKKALLDKERGLGKYQLSLDEKAFNSLIKFANGDARIGLNALDYIIINAPSNLKIIDDAYVASALQKKILRYDKDGEEHYNTISAFIKSMRDSNPDAALYWLARMVSAGEDPRFIARRMIIFASEDIGNIDPKAIMVATSVAYAVEHVGMPEAQINLAQAVTYLASAPKDNASYRGLMEAHQDVKAFGNLPVPMHLRNAVTNLMKDLGYGLDYKYAHDFENHVSDQSKKDLPSELEGKKYYHPRKL